MVGSDIKALKAVDEPMLIRASRHHTVPTKRREFNGIFSVG